MSDRISDTESVYFVQSTPDIFTNELISDVRTSQAVESLQDLRCTFISKSLIDLNTAQDEYKKMNTSNMNVCRRITRSRTEDDSSTTEPDSNNISNRTTQSNTNDTTVDIPARPTITIDTPNTSTINTNNNKRKISIVESESISTPITRGKDKNSTKSKPKSKPIGRNSPNWLDNCMDALIECIVNTDPQNWTDWGKLMLDYNVHPSMLHMDAKYRLTLSKSDFTRTYNKYIKLVKEHSKKITSTDNYNNNADKYYTRTELFRKLMAMELPHLSKNGPDADELSEVQSNLANYTPTIKSIQQPTNTSFTHTEQQNDIANATTEPPTVPANTVSVDSNIYHKISTTSLSTPIKTEQGIDIDMTASPVNPETNYNKQATIAITGSPTKQNHAQLIDHSYYNNQYINVNFDQQALDKVINLLQTRQDTIRKFNESVKEVFTTDAKFIDRILVKLST